jgi:predicted nucleic-acid-binding protein
MVCKSVLLELEWVMRGYYGFSAAEIASAMNHLLSMPQVVVEDREAVEQTLAHAAGGLELADALHLASYRECVSVASFDDRKFARRAKRMGLMPKVVIPV